MSKAKNIFHWEFYFFYNWKNRNFKLRKFATFYVWPPVTSHRKVRFWSDVNQNSRTDSCYLEINAKLHKTSVLGRYFILRIFLVSHAISGHVLAWKIISRVCYIFKFKRQNWLNHEQRKFLRYCRPVLSPAAASFSLLHFRRFWPKTGNSCLNLNPDFKKNMQCWHQISTFSFSEMMIHV